MSSETEGNSDVGGFPELADLGDVLNDELACIIQRRQISAGAGEGEQKSDQSDESPGGKPTSQAKLEKYRSAVDNLRRPLSALCLSGGGIRSAAFALGVVQGLANKGVLQHFDYLSTVSGGGYLGGFLTAWVQREGYDDVLFELQTGKPRTENAKSPLLHLRRYSSYLAPRKGLLTPDALTVASLYVRNLLLNWLIIVPTVACFVVLIKVLSILLWEATLWPQVFGALGLAAITSIAFAVLDSLQERPGWENSGSRTSKFRTREMPFMLFGGITASVVAFGIIKTPQQFTSDVIAEFGVLGGILFLTAALIAYFISPSPSEENISTRRTVMTAGLKYAVIAMIGFALSGFMTGTLLGTALVLIEGQPESVKALILFCFGPPILILAFYLGELVHVGISSYVPWGDGEREWLARAAGYHGRAAAVWMIATLVTFGGSYLVINNGVLTDWLRGLIGVGASSGIVATILGKASSTAATAREQHNTWLNWSAAKVLAVVTPLFFIIAVVMLSAGIDLFVLHVALPNINVSANTPNWVREILSDACFAMPKQEAFASIMQVKCAFPKLLEAFVCLAGLAILASYFVNTNRFSMHGTYRNRLIRAFLGASNGVSNQRVPNPFTDFDEKDNLYLASLWPNALKANETSPQFLVVNMALNIVATKELAWQERKALSFVATPRCAGCARLGPDESGRFRPTFLYGGAKQATLARRIWNTESGMSVGTAMTISGAAASPNMGYHSSSALSLLLTFFNVRLGAWLGNPAEAGKNTYYLEGPTFAAVPLIQEALGITNEFREYVYLSDGGHFENLGLYEMIQRRCRLIVVSDAGCDPSVSFEDLGNAVRKASIDFNVKIEFRNLSIAPRSNPPSSGMYWAMGVITYPGESSPSGILIYLKPSYHGSEPASVRSYAATNPAFPHESTSDQWFGESQFEAYRALGQYVIETIDGQPESEYPHLSDFMQAAVNELSKKEPNELFRKEPKG